MADPRAPFPFLFALLLFFILPLIISQNGGFAEAGKRRVQITDDLDDVVDEEEDETWKEWGKKKTSQDFDLSPDDLNKMDLPEIQAEMMKRHSGPAFGFIKLRFGVKRTKNMVAEIAAKWSKLLRSGAIGVRFMGIDISTIMVNMERGQDMTQLKEFVLSQPEAYEFKIGEQAFRRPGDPPLEEVIQKLQEERNKNGNDGSTETNNKVKEEL